MAEPRDDKVSAAFRGLPPLQPPPALDDAIRAAARRAVDAKPIPSTRRWALPVSIAAVLALSIGIATHVEREKPLVVDGTPVPAGSAEYPVTQAPAEQPPAGEEARKPETRAKAVPPASPTPEPGMMREAPPAAINAESANAKAPAPEQAPAMATPPAAAAPPPPPRPVAPASALADSARATSEMTPASPMRAKREVAGASVAKEATAPSPEKMLERIAELRSAGRHAEADEALAKFRRDFPDLRIAPELWEKVRAP